MFTLFIALFIVPFLLGAWFYRQGGHKALSGNRFFLVAIYILSLVSIRLIIYDGGGSVEKGTPEGRANMMVILFSLPSLIICCTSYPLYAAIADYKGLHWFWKVSLVLGALGLLVLSIAGSL